MKIEFEGRTWDFDPDSMDVRQATVLYMTYQLTIAQYSEGFDTLDQRVYHYAYWLMLQQNGVVKTIAECNPNIIRFIGAFTEARVAKAAAEAAEAEARAAVEPDPTNEPPSGPQGEPTASKARASRTATTRRHQDQQQEEESTA